MTELDRYGHPIERIKPERPPQPQPLTSAELQAVIDLVVGYTRREPDKTMIEVWATQSVLGRWTYDEAAQAIHHWGYNREPNQFLEPSDVTRIIRADRQDRALCTQQRELEATPADPAAAERIQEIIGQLSEQMGWTEPGTPRSGFALKVACPHCRAPEGKRCVNPATDQPLRKSTCHDTRAQALAAYLRGTP